MAESKVDKQVLSLLDIIGSAIVDNFYNHLYDKAIALKEKTNKSFHLLKPFIRTAPS